MKKKPQPIGSPELADQIARFVMRKIAADDLWASDCRDFTFGERVSWRGRKVKRPTAPRGWKFAGAGVSRITFLGPDGFIYKVQQTSWSNQSDAEWQNYLDYLNLEMPPKFRVPQTFRYVVEGKGKISNTVLVAEHCIDDPDVDKGDWEEWVWDLSSQVSGKVRSFILEVIADIHPGNFKVVNDEFVMIDFA